jgi:GAF domain-containing protein
MLAAGHKLGVGGPSMIGWTTFHRQPRITLDVGQEAVRFNNPHLPLTHSELALPILSGNRCLGALTVQSGQPDAFDQDDITMLQAIGDSLAIALENARLYQQTQASLEEIRGLHRQYLSRMWASVKQLPGESSYTFEAEPPAPTGASPEVIEVPLALRDQRIGNLTIESDGISLSPEEMALVEAVANETAVALENARLLDETQRRAQRERLLAEISAKVRASSDIDVVLRTAILELGRALRASEGIIQIKETNNGVSLRE